MCLPAPSFSTPAAELELLPAGCATTGTGWLESTRRSACWRGHAIVRGRWPKRSPSDCPFPMPHSTDLSLWRFFPPPARPTTCPPPPTRPYRVLTPNARHAPCDTTPPTPHVH